MRRVSLTLAFLVCALLSLDARAKPIGAACGSDKECDAGSICTQNVCSALPKGRTIFPFYWYQPGDVGHRHFVPFWYHVWDRQGQVRVQFPFFAQTQSYKEQSTTTIIPPLLSYWTVSPTEKSFRLWPIFWASKYYGENAGSQAALLPIFWWKSTIKQKQFIAPLLGTAYAQNSDDDTQFAMGLFLGYYYRHGDSKWRVGFPMYWDHETATTRSIVVPPLFGYTRDETHRSAVFFPLVWHFANDEKQTQHTLVLPFAEYERDGNRQRLFTLLGGWERNKDAGLDQLVWFAPPIFHRRDPLRDIDVYPPFFARWRAHAENESGWIAGPIYHSQDPDGSTTAAFPIYWGFHDRRTGAQTHLLLPLGGFHSGPGLKGFVLGPLYGWRNTNRDGSTAFGIAPLILFRRASSKYQQMILPLFARWGDDAKHEQTTAVANTFVRTTPDGWDAGFLPIFFTGKHRATNYAYVPPVFWHYSSPEKSVDVVGPAYYARGAKGWAAGLAPIAMFGKLDGVEHEVIPPLLFARTYDRARDREKLLVGPFYHRREGARSLDVLFPLVYLKRAPGQGVLLSPLAYWHKTPTSETLIAGPWLDRKNDETHARTRMLFPLALWHDQPDYHVRVVFPLFWRVRDGAETDTALFPFWWRIRSPTRTVDAVFPLFVHAKTETASTTIAPLAWYRAHKDGSKSLGVLPLFIYDHRVHYKDETEFDPAKSWWTSWAAGPLFYWGKNSDRNTRQLWIGLWFQSHKDTDYTAGLLPLAFAWKRGTESHVLAPLFYHAKDPAADRQVDVIGPLYVQHDGANKHFGLAPFLFVKKDPDTTKVLALPFGYFENRKYGSAGFTWLFGWSKYPTGSLGYVGPVYWRRDELNSSTALWPLAYFHRDRKTGSIIRYAFPFYFDSRTEDGRELQAYTPLAWRYHSVETTAIIGFPFVYDVNIFGQSRTTGVLPLFVRHDSKVSSSTQWFFPPVLTWARTRRGADPGVDVVVFPAVWRFGGKDPTTIVAPIYWDFQRGPNRTTVLFPIFAKWNRPDSEHLIVLNTYFHKGIGKDNAGSWYFYLFPLGDFGRPRKGDLQWNVIHGLFGYHREGINRFLRLFWIWDIPLKPLNPNELSWFTSTASSARTEF